MKSFFKYLLATIIGMLIVGLVLMFIFIGSLGAMFAGSSKAPVVVKDNSVLQIDLDKTIADKSRSASFDGLSFFSSPDLSKTLGLNDMLKAIGRAKEDPKIKGIYLNYEGAGIGFATTQELRKALADFKESGKFVYAYADAYSQNAYHLASVADSVFIQPQGMMSFQGLAAHIMFYTKFLEKIGVEMQVVRHGQFKSAVEPYFRTNMSEANRMQYRVMFDAMWNTVTEDVSASRRLSEARVNEIADSLLGFTASNSLRAGLVDAMVPRSFMKETLLPARLGVSDSMGINTVKLSDYADLTSFDKKMSKNRIAVVYAEGEIVTGKGSSGNIGTDLALQIQKALKEKDVKALVLRVNSPGGNVLTADVIYQELLKAKGKLPIVASYGNYAASGGYYISCMADKIYASPNTLTGSIGVFGMIPNAKKLFDDKLGLKTDQVSTNKNSTAFMSVFRPMTAYENAVMQQNIEEIYAGFVEKVAAGRRMTPAQVDSIGQGRVWSGTNALEIGLVDELGGLEDAIACAAELAGLSDYTVVEWPKDKSISAQLMEMLGNMEARSAEAHIAHTFGTAGLDVYSQLRSVLQTGEPQVLARMPEVFVFE